MDLIRFVVLYLVPVSTEYALTIDIDPNKYWVMQTGTIHPGSHFPISAALIAEHYSIHHPRGCSGE